MSSSNKRIRGLAVSRPVLIGTTATPLSAADKIVAPPDHTHRWTIAVRSAASYPLPPVAQVSAATAEEPSGISTRGRETEADYHKMVGGEDDISYFIKRVSFKLHETYASPTRTVEKPPFQVTETGWGEFEIQIKIFFVPEANEKPITYFHHLKLHPWLPPSLTAAVPPPSASQPGPQEAAMSDKPNETAEMVGGNTLGAEVPQVATTAPGEGEPDSEKAEGSPVAPSVPASTTVRSEAPNLSQTVDASTGAGSPATVPLAPQPQVRMPPVIHSWQYEEIVFPEPSEAFYEVLIRHPPTPLPSLSAQAFTDPHAYQRYQARKNGKIEDSDGPTLPPHPLHNPAGSLFDALSQEAVAGESKRLDDARITIVNEIEKGRMELIQKERQLRELRSKIDVS